jgi:hypothetical protein
MVVIITVVKVLLRLIHYRGVDEDDPFLAKLGLCSGTIHRTAKRGDSCGKACFITHFELCSCR